MVRKNEDQGAAEETTADPIEQGGAPDTFEDENPGELPPEEGEPQEAAYVPNLSYRILDQEHQFPERIQALVKSKEDEEYWRDLVERAHGLDHVKNDRASLRNENTELRETNSKFQEFYHGLQSDAQKGDWDTYFERQGVPPEVILKQAQKYLGLIQDPNKRQAYTEQRNQFWDQQSMAQQQQSLQETVAQSREREVEMLLTYHPEVSQVAQQFDQRMGAGSFRREMVAYGQRVFATEQRDASADEAANYILKLIGHAPSSSAHAPNVAPQAPNTPSQGHFQQPVYGARAGQPPTPPLTSPASQARPPVLPHIEGGGSGGAPVRRPTVQSIDDLHRIRAERRAGTR